MPDAPAAPKATASQAPTVTVPVGGVRPKAMPKAKATAGRAATVTVPVGGERQKAAAKAKATAGRAATVTVPVGGERQKAAAKATAAVFPWRTAPPVPVPAPVHVRTASPPQSPPKSPSQWSGGSWESSECWGSWTPGDMIPRTPPTSSPARRPVLLPLVGKQWPIRGSLPKTAAPAKPPGPRAGPATPPGPLAGPPAAPAQCRPAPPPPPGPPPATAPMAAYVIAGYVQPAELPAGLMLVQTARPVPAPPAGPPPAELLRPVPAPPSEPPPAELLRPVPPPPSEPPEPAEPKRKSRRLEVPQEELQDLAAERTVSAEMELRWRERGPPGPPQGGPTTWRGQAWREGSQRFGNRGGRLRAWYDAFYRAKRAGGEELQRFLRENPKPREAGA